MYFFSNYWVNQFIFSFQAAGISAERDRKQGGNQRSGQLSVVGGLLVIVCCWLLVVGCSLFVVGGQLLIACCLLLVAFRKLFALFFRQGRMELSQFLPEAEKKIIL